MNYFMILGKPKRQQARYTTTPERALKGSAQEVRPLTQARRYAMLNSLASLYSLVSLDSLESLG